MTPWHLRAAQIREDARFQRLSILVWGPGDPGPTASEEKRRNYEKRLQMMQVLRERFPRADIHMSEDSEIADLLPESATTLQLEAIQAKVADLVLILDVSRGADLELDYFVPTYPWFREKVYVFLPEQYVSTQGLVRGLLDELHPKRIIGYTQQELEQCTVATVRTVEVTTVAAVEYMLKT